MGSEFKHNSDVVITFRHITNLPGIQSYPHHFCALVSPSSTTQVIIAPTPPFYCVRHVLWNGWAARVTAQQRRNVTSALLPSPFLLHLDGGMCWVLDNMGGNSVGHFQTWSMKTFSVILPTLAPTCWINANAYGNFGNHTLKLAEPWFAQPLNNFVEQ